MYGGISKDTEQKEVEKEFSFKNYFVPLTTLKAIHFIILIGLIIFFLSLFNNFIGDDNTQIIDNSSITSLQNVPEFFFDNRLDTGGQNKAVAEQFTTTSDSNGLIKIQFDSVADNAMVSGIQVSQ
jgi:hypothetical protein